MRNGHKIGVVIQALNEEKSIGRVLNLSKLETLGDLTLHRIEAALVDLRKAGVSASTVNAYKRSIKQFTRWLWRDGRVVADPLAPMSNKNSDADRRYWRRALQEEEINWLIDTAERGPVVLGMCGPDRAMLYRVALGTGFRAAELRSLTSVSLELDTDPPSITINAAYSKRGRNDMQPIRADLAQMLRTWFGHPGKGASVFPDMPEKTAKMISTDLRRARVRWIRDAEDRRERQKRRDCEFLSVRDDAGAVCDFHALRHTFITNLARAGVHPKQAQELARHSTISLTMDYYRHIGLNDLTAALDRLPGVAIPKTSDGPLRAKARITTSAYASSSRAKLRETVQDSATTNQHRATGQSTTKGQASACCTSRACRLPRQGVAEGAAYKREVSQGFHHGNRENCHCR